MTREIVLKNHLEQTFKVWFYFEQLYECQLNPIGQLKPIEGYVVYFNFSEPTAIIHGELIRKDKSPIFFDTIEEGLEYGIRLVKRTWNLK